MATWGQRKAMRRQGGPRPHKATHLLRNGIVDEIPPKGAIRLGGERRSNPRKRQAGWEMVPPQSRGNIVHLPNILKNRALPEDMAQITPFLPT